MNHHGRKEVSRHRLASLFFVCLTAVAGCDAGTANRVSVEGTITYNGDPVESGTILFSPTEQGQRQASGSIEDGQYAIAADHGPSPGDYTVRIEGWKATSVAQDVGPLYANDPSGVAAATNVEPYIPPEFNSVTTLRVTITRDSGKGLDFDLRPAK